MKSPDPAPDRALARALARWFNAAARDLPWRTQPRDPYLSLVSEFMLQQTQVSRVLERYAPFIEKFPDIRRLARAPEDAVLAMWSGMGYYRRARNLHAAAREIVSRFGGRIPRDVADLRTLPGVGRYTAGAISSIVFNQPAPIVDGNVARVLMRIRGRSFAHGSADGNAWAWKQAEALVHASSSAAIPPATLNEGLMELGALVCTPRSPACGECPVRAHCVAFRRGVQESIPGAGTPARQSTRFCDVVVVTDRRGRLLVEQRPRKGLWAGLWQAPTLERTTRAATPSEVAAWIGVPVIRRSRFTHQITHREVRFAVWTAARPIRSGAGRSFHPPGRIAELALSSPQRRILLGAAGDPR